MKRLLMLLNFALVFSSLALAENFSGKYVLESGEGDTVLNVRQNARGEVQGTLELDDGTLYQLGGEIENNEAIGIASNQGRTNLFKLRFQGGQLIYTLIAIGPDGNPDLANAQEFPFTRQGGGEALGAAGPMTADPAASGGAASDPFVGTFADERATLQLSGSGGTYTGKMQFQGQTFPVWATSPDGRSLNGTFTSGGNSFSFNAILQGPALAFTTSGATYNLRRSGPQQAAPAMSSNPLSNPLGGQAPAVAQQAAQGPGGAINDPYMGVSFDPPQGWRHEKRQAIYVMGHMTIPGMIIVMPHSYNSVQEVKASANESLYQGQDGQLMLTRALQVVSQNMLVGDFGGVLGGQQARGRIIFMLSPHGGGVLILAGADAGSYTQQYASLAEGVARSMKFSRPQESPEVPQWVMKLRGRRLVSLTSGGDASYGLSHNWTDRQELYLCSNGSFQGFGSFSGVAGGVWLPQEECRFSS